MTIYIDKMIKIDRVLLGGLGATSAVLSNLRNKLTYISEYFYKHYKYKTITTCNRKYYCSIHFKTKHNLAMVRIVVGITKSKDYYITWELWPQNITADDFKFFTTTILKLNDGYPAFIYDNVFSKGKINKIELACDLKTPDIHELIFWKPRTRSSHIYKYPNSTQKGTKYLGSLKSQLRFAIYDKAKQLREKKIYTPWQSYTRIEARLAKIKITLKQLPNIISPFLKLHISSAIDCKEKWKEPEWHQFIETALEFGYSTAISIQTKTARTIFHKRLKECAVTFWKPEGLLINLYKEVRELHPIHIQAKLINYSI